MRVALLTLFVGLAAVVLPRPSLADAAEQRESAAIGALARQFDRHPLILIGELHRSREIHAFLQRLLATPEFICRADAIVVEFGNSRFQPLVDAYVAGADVPEDELRHAWQDTAVPLTWNAPMYRRVFERVREIHRAKFCAHPLRLVLADPPLDWSAIHSVADYAPWDDRDGSYARVVEREVLAKGQRALLIAGLLHALRTVPEDIAGGPEEHTLAQRLAEAHPGALYSVATVPFAEAAVALGLPPAPSFSPLAGSPFAAQSLQYADFMPSVVGTSDGARRRFSFQPDKHWPRLDAAVDGLLWLGGNHADYPPATVYRDRAYQDELRRRAGILKAYSGQDFGPVLEALIAEADAAP